MKSYKQVATSVSPAALLTAVPTLEFKAAALAGIGKSEIASKPVLAGLTEAGVVIEKGSPPLVTEQTDKQICAALCSISVTG